MTEKRKYPRYSCTLKVNYEYFEGDPEKEDDDISVPNKGRGFIYDISQGGVFIVSNDRVTVNQLIKLAFSTKKKDFSIDCRIARTGIIKNNPSEIAQRMAGHTKKGDSYIACEFITPIADFTPEDI